MTSPQKNNNNLYCSAETALRRLADLSVQQSLAKVVVEYYDHVQDLINGVLVENAGARQENLENEIYACFHHIARGLCEADSNPVDEISKAGTSHMKRISLDSYKLIITSYIEEYNNLIETLKYLSLSEDFLKYKSDTFHLCTKILASASSAKEFYGKAGIEERRGHFDESHQWYNQSLAECIKLRRLITEFTQDGVAAIASAREVRKEKIARRNVLWTRILIIAGPVIGALFAFLFQKLF